MPTRSCSPRAISSLARAPARMWPRPASSRTSRRAAAAASAPQFDFFPGSPDLAAFPRTLWLRAMREVLRSAPNGALAYPDARGAPQLRLALSSYLRRVRGVVVEPDAIVVCSGATQGLALLGRALVTAGIGEIDVEDPGLPPHRAVLHYAGLRVRGAPVDEQGLQVGAAARRSRAGHARAPVPDRRRAFAGAARRARQLGAGRRNRDRGRLRRRVSLRPRSVGRIAGARARARRLHGHRLKDARAGSASRLAGAAAVAARRGRAGQGARRRSAARCSTSSCSRACSQTSAYDRHLRRARRRNRARRDALIAAVARELPHARVSGISAGLHALVRLPRRRRPARARRGCRAPLAARLPARVSPDRAARACRRAGDGLREPLRAGDRRGRTAPGRRAARA